MDTAEEGKRSTDTQSTCSDRSIHKSSFIVGTEDPDLVTWSEGHDPENPYNWPSKRKWKITLLTSFQTCVPTYASSAMAPVLPHILAQYNNSNRTVGSLMDSIMVLMWGLGCFIWAPMSEVLGRKNVQIFTSIANIGFSIGCALAPNTASMIVFRAFSGFFNSASIAIGPGTVSDMYDDKERQWPLAIWDLAPTCAPAIGPIISAWIAEKTHWQWAFWAIVLLQGLTLGLIVLFYEETYVRVVLAKKKARLQKETGNSNLHTVYDIGHQPILQKIKLAIVRPALFLSCNPVVFMIAVYMAYTYGFMYLVLNAFPDLWIDVYHYSPGIGGLMYIGYAIGTIIGVFAWTTAINWWYNRRCALGKVKLEDRLFFLPFSAITFSGGVMWYGWSAEYKLHWIMPVIGIAFFSSSVFCVFQCSQSYLVSLNVQLSGSIVAACALFRSILGGTFPLFGHAMYERLGYGWASSTVAFLAIALGLPWPLMIYIHGPKLRKWVDERVKIK